MRVTTEKRESACSHRGARLQRTVPPLRKASLAARRAEVSQTRVEPRAAKVPPLAPELRMRANTSSVRPERWDEPAVVTVTRESL